MACLVHAGRDIHLVTGNGFGFAVVARERDPTGALPMEGYGAGAYVLHLLERDVKRNAEADADGL